jgi:DNA (cytosine-5)-methyltransferase 1
MMTVGSLFSGIGGFDLGLERAGMEVKWQVEIDPFCNKVLAKHWPDVKRYGDIRNVGKDNLESVDLICGGFPCQPFSSAGKQRGEADDRYLWPEMLRVISEVNPTWIIGENVAGIISMAIDQVLSDLEGLGFETQAVVVPACSLGAIHIRQRVWILAHSKQGRWRPDEQIILTQERNMGNMQLPYSLHNGESFEFNGTSKEADWLFSF